MEEVIRVETFVGNENPKLKSIINKLREVVFVIEQNVSQDIEFDEFEQSSKYYLMYLNDLAVATARWRETSEGVKIERFAVLSNYRNKKLGQRLLKIVMDEILQTNKQMYMHAQKVAMNIYLRNGFIPVGEMFMEADIEHFKMIYKPD